MLGSVKVKLVPATLPESPKYPEAGVVQVGEPVKPELSVIGQTWIRLFTVTAEVLIVYEVVVAGTTTDPDGADPHAAGEALFTLQFVCVL